MGRETKKLSKVYKTSQESWFYKTFIKNTVNDNFYTVVEVLGKDNNQELISKIRREIKIDSE